MPYLNVSTNQTMDKAAQLAAVAKLSQACAEMLGKPESYMMVSLNSDQCMSFGGSSAPCAIVGLASLGLPESKTGDFSKSLCTLIGEICQLPSDRIYIHFTNPQRHMWGWNQSTF